MKTTSYKYILQLAVTHTYEKKLQTTDMWVKITIDLFLSVRLSVSAVGPTRSSNDDRQFIGTIL